MKVGANVTLEEKKKPLKPRMRWTCALNALFAEAMEQLDQQERQEDRNSFFYLSDYCLNPHTNSMIHVYMIQSLVQLVYFRNYTR